MVEFNPAAMEKLVELLRPPEPEVLQGDDLASGDFEITATRGKVEPKQNAIQTPKTIEEYEEQEAKEAEELGRVGGGIAVRKTPEYTMSYQQAVTAEDVFLQTFIHMFPYSRLENVHQSQKSLRKIIAPKIGPKSPSSASCENLIVRIKMPGDKKENVELSVETQSVVVQSSQYSLNLPLPHGINPDMSKANWDSTEETLVLILKLDREFDFVNF